MIYRIPLVMYYNYHFFHSFSSFIYFSREGKEREKMEGGREGVRGEERGTWEASRAALEKRLRRRGWRWRQADFWLRSTLVYESCLIRLRNQKLPPARSKHADWYTALRKKNQLESKLCGEKNYRINILCLSLFTDEGSLRSMRKWKQKHSDRRL